MAGDGGDDSLVSVTRALLGNSVVATLKFTGAFLTGSSAMFSEAFHSVGDVTNQAALLVGIKRGIKRADPRFPFGRGKERYAWNLIAVMIVGFLGGITAKHAFESIIDGHVPDYLENANALFSVGAVSVTSFWVVQAILSTSLLIEGYTLWVAKKVVWKQKGEKSLWEYIRESSDPTAYAVLFEDSVAVLGVLIAVAGIWFTTTTGNPLFDGIAAMCIAALILTMAIFLLFANIPLITGRSDPELHAEIEKLILSHPSVERVHRISTEIRGADSVSANVWVEFKEEAIYHDISNGSGKAGLLTPRAIVEMGYSHVTELIDSLRHYIMKEFPEVTFLCIEPEFPKAIDKSS